MSAILFGSIGTIADTSELQRDSFNHAFAVHGLDWNWERPEYVEMLRGSGGVARIAEYAAARGETVDAAAVHATKSETFRARLSGAQLGPRPGVVESIAAARAEGMKVALVTTTARANLDALAAALSASLPFSDFDLIVDSASVDQPKPDKAAYAYALARLGETPADCFAVEDNMGGVAAAVSAGLTCVAFPNANTIGHDFSSATRVIDQIDLDEARDLLGGDA